MNNSKNIDNILKNIETKIRNNGFKNKEELETHLIDLKNRGILTQAQINLKSDELLKIYEIQNRNENPNIRRITRTPQKEYYSNAGFSNISFLVLNIITLTLAIAMIVMFNK